LSNSSCTTRSTPQVLLTEEDRILAYVKEHGSITNSECRNLLEVNDDRARYLLKKLVTSGALKPVGQGRWRRYVLP